MSTGSTLFFPDNTVLVNFGLIGRMDLLERVLGGSGRWCISVAGECQKSSSVPGLETVAQAGDFLGEAYIPDQAERINTIVIQDRMRSIGDPPTAHLGEAETIAIIESRFSGAYFVSDDAAAKAAAAAAGIAVVTTYSLLKLIVRAEFVECIEMVDFLSTLRDKGRQAPMVTTVSQVRSWAGMPPPDVIEFGAGA